MVSEMFEQRSGMVDRLTGRRSRTSTGHFGFTERGLRRFRKKTRQEGLVHRTPDEENYNRSA
jgi:hypothetical protein